MSENKKYKLIVAYDGTDFSGWQVQSNKRSVADCIEQHFYAVFKKKIRLLAASRTDAGVHAYGQVATLCTDLAITAPKLQGALQASLPSSIVIRTVQEVAFDFHPRYDVVQKTYTYTLFLKRPLPWQQRYGYFHAGVIDVALLHKALQVFVGTHDFRSFCSGDDATTTIRTIDSIESTYSDETTLVVTFKAKGFLRYMIRRIMGAALTIAEGKMALQALYTALAEKNPNQRFMMAPAHGLLLYDICYK